MPMEGEELEIRRLDLSIPCVANRIKTFLNKAGLRLDKDVHYFAGLFDANDNLAGCGGVDGNIIKCLAIQSEARGTGAAATLISHLVNEIFNAGHTNVRVFTKPECGDLFRSLGFTVCGEGSTMVLLESDSMPLKKYCQYLAKHQADGVIVANADPLTLGHLHLITLSAQQCHKLVVIAVGSNAKNTFDYPSRTAMLRKATAHLSNVEVIEGSEYVVSQLSFPSYFLKKVDEVSRSQAEVDLDIFCRHIVPALGCAKRFVGTEPTDMLTAQYNTLMKERLPANGVEVVEIERLTDGILPISASRVRRALHDGRLQEALLLVPPSDTPYLLAFLAIRALRKELALAPKPGLVDPYDNGSHTDMDYALMSHSIDALKGYFIDMAVTAFETNNLYAETLRTKGVEAEKRMLSATNGVNTHRGAIFSMGLAVAAAARILAKKSARTLSNEIAHLAKSLKRPTNTHGQLVHSRFGTSGALENAQTGYAQLFESWLPFYQNSEKTDADSLRLLLKIICELDDSNAIYRAGPEKAHAAQQAAAQLATGNCTTEMLQQLNDDFKRNNISHGGAADMLALTFFIDSIQMGAIR